MKQLLKFTLIFWIVSGFLPKLAHSQAISEEQAMRYPIFQVASILSRMGWKPSDSYYGTAIQFEFDRDNSYFVALYHTLPRDRSRWNQLYVHMHGAEAGKTEKMLVEPVGLWPGYDLALLRVNLRAEGIEHPHPEQWQAHIRKQFRSENVGGKTWRIAVMGTADGPSQALPSLSRFLWQEEARLLSSIQSEPLVRQNQTNEELLREWRASDVAIPLPLSSDCHPSYVTECYRVPMRTGGYSGSAFLVAPETNAHEVSIAGIVWGYSPVARTTIVLPWHFVHPLATELLRRYRAQGTKGRVEILDDVSGTFTYVGPDAIAFKPKGAAKARIASRGRLGDNFQLGGGEGSGGGGEGSGGGGEGSGGGGEGSGGGGEGSGGGGEGSGGGGEGSGGGGTAPYKKLPFLRVGPSREVAALVDYPSLEREFSRPAHWNKNLLHFHAIVESLEHLRGTRALLTYTPGIEIDGIRYHRYNDTPLANMASFVNAYKNDPQGELLEPFTRRTFPSQLAWQAGNDFNRFGLIGRSSLNFMNYAQAVAASSDTWMNDVQRQALAAWQKNGLAAKESMQMLWHRQDIGTLFGSLSAGRLRTTEDHFEIELESPRFAQLGGTTFKFVSNGPFEAQGELFQRYQGPLTYTPPPIFAPALKSGPAKIEVKSFVSLQYVPSEARYELKLFYIGKLPPTWNDLPTFYTNKMEFPNFYLTAQKMIANCDLKKSFFLEAAYIPLLPTP